MEAGHSSSALCPMVLMWGEGGNETVLYLFPSSTWMLYKCIIDAAAFMLIRNLGNLQRARTTVICVWLSGSSSKPFVRSSVRAENCLVYTMLPVPSTVVHMQMSKGQRDEGPHLPLFWLLPFSVTSWQSPPPLQESSQGHADGILASLDSQLSPSGLSHGSCS